MISFFEDFNKDSFSGAKTNFSLSLTFCVSKSFTKSYKQSFPKNNYNQGDKLTIPWTTLRPDLELEPLIVKKPLYLKKVNRGVRHALYRFQNGDTLYSSVIIRFVVNTKHYNRNKNALYLLELNGINDARQISNGKIIKIPLILIKPEYFHQVPGIYKNYLESNFQTLQERNFFEFIPPNKAKSINFVSLW